jgi:hypothetical protein
VHERIKEIRDNNIVIGYVKSEDNPADIATRGRTVEKLKNDKLWWNGPNWISLPCNEWPTFSYEITNETQYDVKYEEKGKKVLYETGLVASPNVTEGPFGIIENHYSSYSKLTRVTAWCVRFVNNLRKHKLSKEFLTVDEIGAASVLWIKYIQNKYFNDVFKALESGKNHSLVSQLGLYKDLNGILRCAGRFVMLKDHPKLLPKESQYTKLCIIRDHKRLLHAGVSHTLAEIRKEHWVIQGRSAVRKIIRQCLICLHWEGGPFQTPNFAHLPKYVLSDEYPPFTFIAMDYLGPLLVKNESSCIKKWVCLFTCLNVRAIHLELVDDLTTDSFLLCLRRFLARRGTPSLIMCDNASNFKQGCSVIDKIWKRVTSTDDVQSYVANKGIQWKFITDYAPWKGGIYERLVGITKKCMRKVLGKSKVTSQELVTVITEIEAVVNSRPLVYADDDINSGQVLTPGHFLSINYKTGHPDIKAVNSFESDSKATKLDEEQNIDA